MKLTSVKSVRRAMRVAGAAACAVCQAGCGAGWRTTPIVPGPLPPRQQAQVWTGGQARQWHALVISADSVSGVPFTRSPACDSCRVGVARDAVDSIRVGNPSAGLWKSVALTGAAVLAGALVFCRLDSSCQLSD
jgi:hypothetical protein